MKRAYWIAALVAVVLAICVISIVRRVHAKRRASKPSLWPSAWPTAGPSAWGSQRPALSAVPRGSSAWPRGARDTSEWQPASVASKSPRSRKPLFRFFGGGVEQEDVASQPYVFSRRPIETLPPTSVAPFTLAPVPNGLTPVPRPPTVQPYRDVDYEERGRAATLYDQPAGSAAANVGGVGVPAVQNPWSTDSWKFLIGTNANTAVEIVENLFPSFPLSIANIREGPQMSGGLVLKVDDSNKVVAIVRD